MRITHHAVIVCAVSLLLMAFSEPPAPPEVLDGAESSRLTEVSYAFHCRGSRTALSYRQERHDPGRVSALSDAVRVTLSRLSVSGRRIEREGLQAARRVFRAYAMIEQVEVRCFRDDVDILVRGVDRRPWVDFLEERLKERPRPAIHTIRISKSGAVRII